MDVIHICSEDFTAIEPLYKDFLTEISKETLPALANMGYDEPAGLGHIAKNKIRWTSGLGQIDFLVDEGKIVGVSAVEISSTSSVFSSGGNRCWLLPKYRGNNEITKYLLASNLQWAKEQNHVGMILTFNNYNKWIYDTVKKRIAGRSSALGTVWSNWWNDCIPFDRQLNIHYTPQWAIVKPIGSTVEVLDGMKNIDAEFGIKND